MESHFCRFTNFSDSILQKIALYCRYFPEHFSNTFSTAFLWNNFIELLLSPITHSSKPLTKSFYSKKTRIKISSLHLGDLACPEGLLEHEISLLILSEFIIPGNKTYHFLMISRRKEVN